MKFLKSSLIYIGIILVVSIMLFSTYLTISFIPDKISHFFAYMCLAIILCKVFHLYSHKKFILIEFYAITICITLGILLELLQHFFPTRVVDFQDIIANIFGTIIGGSLFYLFKRSLLKKI